MLATRRTFPGASGGRLAPRLPLQRPACISRLPVVCPRAAAQQKITTVESPHTQEPSPVLSFLKQAAKGAAVAAMALALVLGRCDAAHAARSAGRAGGFSGGHSASRSYGGGGGRSYSGGGYSGGISSFSAPSLSYRAPIIVPGPPIIAPSPYYSTGLMAPAVVSTGPGLVDVAIISMFLVMAASAARTALSDGSGVDGSTAGGGRPTLTRVQVGLLSLARELKSDLDEIASHADTSDSRGLHQLLQEVALALLRNPRYCAYGDASQQSVPSAAALEAAFNRASLAERSKFEQETLVNVGGRRRRSGYSGGRQPAGAQPDELIVVTLLVATGCRVELPAKINSLGELQAALKALGAVPADEVLGVELLWTPQAEGDYYTREEIAADYPSLRNL